MNQSKSKPKWALVLVGLEDMKLDVEMHDVTFYDTRRAANEAAREVSLQILKSQGASQGEVALMESCPGSEALGETCEYLSPCQWVFVCEAKEGGVA